MPDQAGKALFKTIATIVVVVVSIAAIAFSLIAILGNPAWSSTALYNTIYNFQTIIGGGLAGGLALIGIWLGFRGNRRRDEGLRDQEARALALALYGELTGALVTCSAFVRQVTAPPRKPYDKEWLDQKNIGKNVAPRVRTKVYEANLDKLGLLGEPLVRGGDPTEHLIVEIVVTFDQLFDFARMADKEEFITGHDLLKKRADLASHLENNFVPALKETMNILRAYIYGGFPAATKAAHSILSDRKNRVDRLGNELGIDRAPTDEGESES